MLRYGGIAGDQPKANDAGRTQAGEYPDGGLIAVGRPRAVNILTMTVQPTKNSRDDDAAGALPLNNLAAPSNNGVNAA